MKNKSRRTAKKAASVLTILTAFAAEGVLTFSSTETFGKAFSAETVVMNGVSEETSDESGANKPAAAFEWTLDDGLLTLQDGEKVVFSYRYSFLEHENVPKTDSRRGAGCYLYPLNGVDGENLTDLAPKDHYHHRGVFWTWLENADSETPGAGGRPVLLTSVGLRPPSVSKTDL